MLPVLSLQAISKSFQPGVPVLQDFSLHVETGNMVCLLGPSGCGKTTLLRLIAGFEEPTSGEIRLIDQLVSRPGFVVPPEKRQIGMVFQDYALFPHMTVAQNIQFGLFHRATSWRRNRLADLLQLVDLQGMEKRYPHELSGGQQQRVALARALAPNPQLLLLDEPFSNLDVSLRQQLREEMRAILTQTDMTTVLVTHDQEEALSLADTLAVMDLGEIVQYATPEEIIRHPDTRFVVQFLGLGHFVPGLVRDNCITTELGDMPITTEVQCFGDSREVDVLVRPERVRLCSHECGALAEVVRMSYRGTHRLYTLKLPSGHQLGGLLSTDRTFHLGDQIQVTFDPIDPITFPHVESPSSPRL